MSFRQTARDLGMCPPLADIDLVPTGNQDGIALYGLGDTAQDLGIGRYVSARKPHPALDLVPQDEGGPELGRTFWQRHKKWFRRQNKRAAAVFKKIGKGLAMAAGAAVGIPPSATSAVLNAAESGIKAALRGARSGVNNEFKQVIDEVFKAVTNAGHRDTLAELVLKIQPFTNDDPDLIADTLMAAYSEKDPKLPELVKAAGVRGQIQLSGLGEAQPQANARQQVMMERYYTLKETYMQGADQPDGWQGPGQASTGGGALIPLVLLGGGLLWLLSSRKKGKK